MPFEASTLSHLEGALAELFEYHNQLDDFLKRAGMKTILEQARVRAENRSKASSNNYSRAPKRFVVQELINILSENGNEGDTHIAKLVTELINGNFPNASPASKTEIIALREAIARDKKRKQEESIEKLRKQEEIKEQVLDKKLQELLIKEEKRNKLREQFLSLSQEKNHQQRGYFLEVFLKDLFQFEELDPRDSFRNTGEQIDGSFLLNQNVYLLEAKWTEGKSSGAEFGAFLYKLDGKSLDTRGLFVSINGYTTAAIESLKSKGPVRFICLDGAHLYRAFSQEQSLKQILLAVWRHAAETGEAYLPVSKMRG